MNPSQSQLERPIRPTCVKGSEESVGHYFAMERYATALEAERDELRAKVKQTEEDSDLRENWFNEVSDKYEADLAALSDERDDLFVGIAFICGLAEALRDQYKDEVASHRYAMRIVDTCQALRPTPASTEQEDKP